MSHKTTSMQSLINNSEEHHTNELESMWCLWNSHFIDIVKSCIKSPKSTYPFLLIFLFLIMFMNTRRVAIGMVEDEIANVGVPSKDNQAPPQEQFLLGGELRSILRSWRMGR